MTTRDWIIIAVLAASAPMAAQRSATDDRASLIQGIDAKRESYAAVAKQIWGFAESVTRRRKAARCCSSSCEPLDSR